MMRIGGKEMGFDGVRIGVYRYEMFREPIDGACIHAYR